MVVPFGFSVGDFIAGINTLHKVVAALRETDGASPDYCYTLLELEVLESLLRKLQSLQLADMNPEYVEKLRLVGYQCHIPLSIFLRKIKEFAPELGTKSISQKGGFRKYGKRNVRKVQWGICLKKNVLELKAAIAPQLATVGILLQLISLYV